MKWQHIDTTPNWLKVRSEAGRAYFLLWEQDPAFLAIDLLAVIPADPSESTQLTVPLAAGELPWLQRDELATSVIRCPDLINLWWRERRKLERRGELEPMPATPKRRRKPAMTAGTIPATSRSKTSAVHPHESSPKQSTGKAGPGRLPRQPR